MSTNVGSNGFQSKSRDLTYAYSSSSSNDGLDSFDESFSPSLVNENLRQNVRNSPPKNVRNSSPKNVRTSLPVSNQLNMFLASQQIESPLAPKRVSHTMERYLGL